jgi:hypothetical protein
MTKERYEERTWIPHDPDFPQFSNCWEPSFADHWGNGRETCDCGRPVTIIWHFTSDKAEILESFCERCAAALAMGLLRDVAEVTVGNERAMARYQLALKQLQAMFGKQ